MKQAQFVQRYKHEWLKFEAWLKYCSLDTPKAKRRAEIDGLSAKDIPVAYRRICQHLAIARKRSYSPSLVGQLQDLMERGHALIYQNPPPRWHALPEFFLAEFPSLVRAQGGCLWLSAVLFFGVLIATYLIVLWRPDLVYTLFDPGMIANFESMYDPDAERLGRSGGSDVYMFGHYIMNNTSIGLRTFASGLLFGVGTIFVLVFNGLVIGGVAGHLNVVGHGAPFWQFVCGHSAPELLAIVITGAAGLRLGLDIVAPGRRKRIDALIEGGKVGAKICLGAAVMFVFAAFVEAFWSSRVDVLPLVKYCVAVIIWVVILLWLWRGGRGGAYAD